MSEVIIYLSQEEIINIHDEIIRATGGLAGINKPIQLAYLESAPALSYSGQELYPGIFKKSALYLRNINLDHLFNDGNKRTGIAAAARFLIQNGFILSPPEGEIEIFNIRVADEKLGLEVIADWLKTYSKLTHI